MPVPKVFKRFWTHVLNVDSAIDAGFYSLTRWLGDRWTAYSELVDRMRITGWRHLFVWVLSDGLTYGTGVAIIAYCWALPQAPDEKLLYEGEQQYSVVMTDRNGRFLGRRGILHNDAVELDEIPEHVIQAVLATEDERFYIHFGIDFIGTLRALLENVKAGDNVQGGSSITQQVAKNLYLTPEQSIDRKIKEAFLALWIEARLTKREILKLYLDRGYLGGGTFGIEAASEFYFQKSVRDIDIAEAAMLAGLFKAPSKLAPHNNLPAARERANTVLARMVEAGFITEGQARVARNNPARLVENPDVYTPEYFLDWAFDEVKRLAEGRAHVLVARTTLDLSQQKKAEDAVQATLRQSGKDRAVGAAALVSMTLDGAVRAMVGGSDYGESQFNRAVSALRQAGSSWKPFVYLTALRNGMTPQDRILDGPICLGGWCPKNYSHRYAGTVTLARALQKSYNTPPVRLSVKFGRKAIAETAKAVGINSEIRLNLSMALGTNEVTVLDMTGSYATFASAGLKATPHAILELRTLDGEVIYNHERDAPERRQVVEREAVENLNFILGEVVTGGTGRRAFLEFTPAAGKTGTGQDYRDAWFMGFTGELATGVWMGNDNFLPTRRVTGGSLPAQTWFDYMSKAHSDAYAKPIPGIETYGTPKPVETEEDKARRLALEAEALARRERKVAALEKINRLFQEGMLGPVRDTAFESGDPGESEEAAPDDLERRAEAATSGNAQ